MSASVFEAPAGAAGLDGAVEIVLAEPGALGLLTRQERRHTKRGSDINLYGFDGLTSA